MRSTSTFQRRGFYFECSNLELTRHERNKRYDASTNRHEIARALYQAKGAAAAFRETIANAGVGAWMTDREPAVVLPTERPMENIVFLLEHEYAMYDRYWLDFDALKSAANQTRTVFAGGDAQREAYPYRSAAAVADKLGMRLVEFPGGHAGYVTHPKAFASKLREVLEEQF
jgi:pimeloyl-ACP methyl ester carboxylesterase